MTASEDAKRNWYGWGRWDSPVWFVGLEAGGDNAGDKQYDVWRNKHGSRDLVDWPNYCLDVAAELRQSRSQPSETSEIDARKWEGWFRVAPKKPALQPTFRRLIKLMLAYNDEPRKTCDVRACQATRIGRIDQSCAAATIEFSGIHAKSTADRKAERSTPEFQQLRLYRAKHIADKLREFRPKLVVCYGNAKDRATMPLHNLLIDSLSTPDLKELSPPSSVRLTSLVSRAVRDHRTVLAVTVHPNSWGPRDADWLELGSWLATS